MSAQNITRVRRAPLGRGLSALIPTKPTGPAASEGSGLMQMPLEKIHPGHDQPRQNFDEKALDELAASIREHGVLQPIVVRRDGPQNYSIVAGERRWRAAQKAGLREIPAMISEHAEEDSLLLALVENLQREDLNPIEEAEAYQHLSEDFGFSQEQVARRVGKDRSTVANAMRLLKLPGAVRDMLAAGDLSMGHARALLAVDETAAMERLARSIVRKRLSVRDVERRVKLLKAGHEDTQPAARSTAPMSPALRDVTDRLMRALSTKVVVKDSGKGSGSIEIAFGSYEELDRILAQIC